MRRFLLFSLCCLWAGLSQAQPMPRLIPYKTKAGYGYCDSAKNMRIPPRFESAGLFWKGRAPVSVKMANGKLGYGLIDTNGNYILPPEWGWNGVNFLRRNTKELENIAIFSSFNMQDSLGRWGLVDIFGKVCVPALYSSQRELNMRENRSGLHLQYMGQPPYYIYTIAYRDGKMGAVDVIGRELIPFQYDAVWAGRPYNSIGWYQIKKDGKEGIIYLGKPEMVPPIYDKVWPYIMTEDSLGFLMVSKEGKIGIVDTQNKIVIPIMYDTVMVSPNTSKTIFHTRLNNKWGLQSSDGKVYIPPVTKSGLVPRGAFFVSYEDDKETKRQTIYDSSGKCLGTVVAQKGEDIHVFNDDVTVFTIQNRDSDTEIVITKYFILNGKRSNYKVVRKRKMEKLHPMSMGCGGSNGERYIINFRPYLLGENGEKISSIYKGSQFWSIDADLGGLYAVSLDRDEFDLRPAAYGIIDSNQNWVWKPQQDYQILGGNFRNNFLTVQHRKLFGITDTMLRPRTAFTSHFPTDTFKWKGKTYIQCVDSANATKYLRNRWEWREQKISYLILDTAGNITWNPGKKVSFYFQRHKEGKDLPTAVISKDSAGRIGLSDPYGKPIYPLLNGRYKELRIIPHFGFMAEAPKNKYASYYPDQLLLHANGKEWISGIIIRESAWERNTDNLPLLNYPTDPYSPRLLRVIPVEEKQDIYHPLFLNANGIIYADADALPKQK